MKPLGLNHLNLPARDPAALSRWYVENLGFKARGRFLWSGGTLLVFVPGEPAGSAATHFGFRVESLADVRAWYAFLSERGVTPGPIQGDENYTTFHVVDPEGNRFEIFYEPVP